MALYIIPYATRVKTLLSYMRLELFAFVDVLV